MKCICTNDYEVFFFFHYPLLGIYFVRLFSFSLNLVSLKYIKNLADHNSSKSNLFFLPGYKSSNSQCRRGRKNKIKIQPLSIVWYISSHSLWPLIYIFIFYILVCVWSCLQSITNLSPNTTL